MTEQELKSWRQGWKVTQARLAKMLGVHRVTIAKWESGARGIPPFLPLALKALEFEMKEAGKYGSAGGVPGVQEAE
ncbi:MAG: helix-turn-helix transcriptional regulator [Thermodesulfobacteriota bacterium]